MQPILLRIMPNNRFEIVAGERRWRASKMAMLEAIPAVTRELTLMQVLELQAIENTQRENLHPLEEADSYQWLVCPPDGSQGYTAAQVAEKVSREERHVKQRLVLCRLIPQVRDAFWDGVIVLQTAVAIARMPVNIQAKAWPKILNTRPSQDKPVRHADADKILQGAFMLRLANATFPIKDATLVPAAGGCDACPSRTGANPDLFDGGVDHDTCTDPDCHSSKVQAYNARRKAEAKDKGLQVFEGKTALALLKFGPDSTALNADYVYMDEPLEELTGNKSSLHKLLGTLLVPSAVIEHPRDHTLREIVHTDKAKQLLKDHGMLMHRPTKGEQTALVNSEPKKAGKATATPPASPAKQSKEDLDKINQRRHLELVWRDNVLHDIHKAIHGSDMVPEPLLRAAVVDYGSGLVEVDGVWSSLCNMWGWKPHKDYDLRSGPKERLEAVTLELNSHQLMLLLSILCLLPDLRVKDSQIEDEEEVESLLLCTVCDDPDMELGVDWRAIKAQTLKPEPKTKGKRAKKTATDPTLSPPPAGDDTGAPTTGEADTSTSPEEESQARSRAHHEGSIQLPGSAGQKVLTEDGALWEKQFVRVKSGSGKKKRTGQIRGLDTNGDIEVAFERSTPGEWNIESFAASELEPLPGQTRRATPEEWPFPGTKP